MPSTNIIELDIKQHIYSNNVLKSSFFLRETCQEEFDRHYQQTWRDFKACQHVCKAVYGDNI